jgi:hypothetical protein
MESTAFGAQEYCTDNAVINGDLGGLVMMIVIMSLGAYNLAYVVEEPEISNEDS